MLPSRLPLMSCASSCSRCYRSPQHCVQTLCQWFLKLWYVYHYWYIKHCYWYVYHYWYIKHCYQYVYHNWYIKHCYRYVVISEIKI